MINLEKGNTTTYEWLYGEPPQKVDLPASEMSIDDSGDNTADEINWDISEADEIDFNYDVTLEESGIEVEVAEKESNIARGTEALTVLDNPKTRDEFIAQLMEVRSDFLTKHSFMQILHNS